MSISLVPGEQQVRTSPTLLCDLDLSAAELRLLDVLDAEVAGTSGVELRLLARGRLGIGAVCVGGSEA